MKKKLTPGQLDEVIESYCDRVVNEMDIKSMEQMLYDMLVDSFKFQTESDIKELIISVYGEDYYNELVENLK